MHVWNLKRHKAAGGEMRKCGRGGEGEPMGKEMKATAGTSDVSRVTKVDKVQRSRSVVSKQVAVPSGKGIDSKSAAKVYSEGVRLANMRSPQGVRERGRGTTEADSNALQSDDGKANASTRRKQSRSSRSSDEQKTRSTSQPAIPKVKAWAEAVDTSVPRKGLSVKTVARAGVKVSESAKPETPKVEVGRDHVGCWLRDMDAASRGEVDVSRRLSVASGKDFGGAGEDKLRSDCPGIAPVIKKESIKSSQKAGQANVVAVRNPIWPVAYDQHNLTSKVRRRLEE